MCGVKYKVEVKMLSFDYISSRRGHSESLSCCPADIDIFFSLLNHI